MTIGPPTKYPTLAELDELDRNDPFLPQYLDALRLGLAHNNLPDITRRKTVIKAHKVRHKDATVCLLGAPENRISVALEGGRQCPGAVFLCASPHWVTKEGQNLWMHRGIWFDKELRGHLDTYQPPRMVTYFANFMTLPGSDGTREDGVPLEDDICVPQSSSAKLDFITNDKLYTRILLANANVAVPVTLAYTKNPVLEYPQAKSGICEVHPLPENVDTAALKAMFEAGIRKFAGRTGTESKSIVIKPSGRMWMASAGVGIFHQRPLQELVDHAVDLAGRITDADAILIEVFQRSLPSQSVITASEAVLREAVASGANHLGAKAGTLLSKTISSFEDDEGGDLAFTQVGGESLSFRLRVICARDKANRPKVATMVGGIAPASKPINGDNTIPCSLDSILDQWGLTKETKKAVTNAVASEALSAFRAILDAEAELPRELVGQPMAQTDLVGFDFVITTKRNSIVPAIIEVNDHDCTLAAQILEGILPDLSGESVRPWVRTMLWRSDRFLCRGKNLVLVAGGGTSKRPTFKTAKELGMNIILLEEDPEHYAIKEGYVTTFIETQLYDGNLDALAEAAAAKVIALDVPVDGVLTFWEDAGPVCAAIREKLGLPGNSVESQEIAKSKQLTQDKLVASKSSYAHCVSPHLFAAQSRRITDPDLPEFDTLLVDFPFPAVIKLEYGSSAVGVKLVKNKEEARTEIRALQGALGSEDSHPGVGLSFGNTVALTEFLGGSEHDVDLLLHEGSLVCAIVTDNGPTRVPYFAETSASMPSSIHRDKQGALIDAALLCCRTIGIHTGAVNVELKFTSTGPRLIEVNARMGGFYISNWTPIVFDIDWTACTLMLACGIVPAIDQRPEPRKHMVGMQLFTSQHKHALTPIAIAHLRQLHENKHIVYTQFEDELPEEEEFEEPFANIAIVCDDVFDGKEKLLSMAAALGFDDGEIPNGYYFANM